MPDGDEESIIDRLEREFPPASGEAFAAAREEALAAGLSVLIAEDGEIIRINPDGSRELVQRIEPPVEVAPGARFEIP